MHIFPFSRLHMTNTENARGVPDLATDKANRMEPQKENGIISLHASESAILRANIRDHQM